MTTRITEIVFNYLFGRFLRLAILVVLISLFMLIAIYHLTIAGTLALETQYGLLYARLIVAAAYSTAAVIAGIIFWAIPTTRPNENQVAIPAPRNTKMTMIIEAGMFGYMLGRKLRHRVR